MKPREHVYETLHPSHDHDDRGAAGCHDVFHARRESSFIFVRWFFDAHGFDGWFCLLFCREAERRPQKYQSVKIFYDDDAEHQIAGAYVAETEDSTGVV